MFFLPQGYAVVYNVPQEVTPDRSVCTNGVSTLLTFDSLYSTVDKSRKRNRSDAPPKKSLQFNKTASDELIYESLERLVTNKIEEREKAILVQLAAIEQVWRALEYSKNSATFYGSLYHLEAEKCLLVASK